MAMLHKLIDALSPTGRRRSIVIRRPDPFGLHCITVDAMNVHLDEVVTRHGVRLIHPDSVIVSGGISSFTITDSIINDIRLDNGSIMLNECTIKKCTVRMDMYQHSSFDRCIIDELVIYGTRDTVSTLTWIGLNRCKIGTISLYSSVAISIENCHIDELLGNGTITEYHIHNSEVDEYDPCIITKGGTEDSTELMMRAREAMDIKRI